jgi:hypothetical protein
VTRACYDAHEVGQQVVVVYDPRDARRPMLYDLCGYEAVA